MSKLKNEYLQFVLLFFLYFKQNIFWFCSVGQKKKKKHFEIYETDQMMNRWAEKIKTKINQWWKVSPLEFKHLLCLMLTVCDL